MRLLLLLLLGISSFSLLAQTKEEELASQYFQSGEYRKAAEIYDRLYDKGNTTNYLYENYLSTLIKIPDLDEAEKLVKKQIRKNKGNPAFQVDLGYVYIQAGNRKKAEEQFNSLIKNQPLEVNYTQTLASGLLRRGEPNFALEAYQKFRKQVGQSFFRMEVADLQSLLGNKQAMTDEYLDWLLEDDTQEELIQNKLQAAIEKTEEFDYLKAQIVKRIQKDPSNRSMNQLLVWTFIQQKDFPGALIQARALDKRLKEEGARVMFIGDIAEKNQDYKTAAEAYQYVITLGPDHPYYHIARNAFLGARRSQILNGNFTQADLLQLEKEYEDMLNQVGRGSHSSKAMLQLAELELFYLHQSAKARVLLEEMAGMYRLESSTKAQAKLLLGDLYIVEGRYDEALLTYGQVDVDFKEDPLGQEAKLRIARLSYFKGDFEFSRSQLEVLKTATSQLISNDALELSLLIQDNTGLDTSEVAMQMYASAELLLFQNKPADALLKLEELNKKFPGHTLDDEIYLLKARIYKAQKDYPNAVLYYEKVVKEFGNDILADNALMEWAELTEIKLGDKTKAQQLYQQMIDQYPGSLFTVEARKRFRRLRGDAPTQ